ncbi:MAG: MFS transporter [Hyphomonas sp.]|jgi:MFS family permease
MRQSEALAEKRPPIPATVWALGLVSLFMDISSEMIHSLLPLFLTGTLGASVVLVGLIDGIGESTAAISKIFSGYISDKLGRRKPLLLIGYGLGALTKPFFAIAMGPMIVLGARFADRIGKGIRGAPRDALVADVTPQEIRGRAFGLRQSLDTVGAVAGPLIALALMALLASDIRAVFWVAAVPGLIAVLFVLFGVRERRETHTNSSGNLPISFKSVARFPAAFWVVAAIGVMFTLARFSEAFLVLKASEEGLPLVLAPMVLILMNIVYALGAFPAGIASDRIPAANLLLLGLMVLVAADFCLALMPGLWGAFSGITLWGIHLALTQGLLSKLVADHSPADLRGSGFGLFNLLTGIVMLVASLLAGILWEAAGSGATFLAGAVFASMSAGIVVFFRRHLRPAVPRAR